MDISLADRIWMAMAPLISLGHDEDEIVRAISEKGLPERVDVNVIPVSLDYANETFLFSSRFLWKGLEEI